MDKVLCPFEFQAFFVHCLEPQPRVRRPGQEAVSAVYCPSTRRQEGGRLRT